MNDRSSNKIGLILPRLILRLRSAGSSSGSGSNSRLHSNVAFNCLLEVVKDGKLSPETWHFVDDVDRDVDKIGVDDDDADDADAEEDIRNIDAADEESDVQMGNSQF